MRVWINGKRVTVKPAQSIGKGGEADVYDIGSGRALKLFKAPDHPDFNRQSAEQRGAADRLAVHQRKLPAFPKNLPDRVVTPVELATGTKGGAIVGYTMRLVAGAEPLHLLADRAFRAAGVDDSAVVRTFLDLHRTVERLHRARIVLGDFNDLNVLVQGDEAHLIDADSFQFGNYPCPMFTQRFVDPILCVEDNGGLLLNGSHNTDSDWYAFAAMLMQSLVFVDPYGGIFRPRNKKHRVPDLLRPLMRISVFHPEVRYPKPARPLDVLPDDLLHHFHEVVERDRRGEFPKDLLEGLEFHECDACKLVHARVQCPECGGVAPAAIKEATVVRGKVLATHVFRTTGRVVAVAGHDGGISWLAYHDGVLRREDGRAVLSGRLSPRDAYALQGERTIIGRDGRVVVLDRRAERIDNGVADVVAGRTMVTANERHRYWVHAGRLLRDGRYGPEPLGEVLSGQTRLFVGERFGLGFYNAADLCVGFVFDAERAGLNDSVPLPRIPAQLIDVDCTFSDSRAWLLTATSEQGQTVHTCTVVRADGEVEASARALAGDDSWLGTLRGKCAVGDKLLAATDEGFVRVEVIGGQIAETKRFPDTEPFVASDSRLIAGRDGLYVAGDREITLLRIQ